MRPSRTSGEPGRLRTTSSSGTQRPRIGTPLGASVDLRVGGSFSSRMEAKDGSMGFDFAGTYTKVVANELIECSFGERTLRVEFSAGASGVTVCETFDAESTHSVEQQREGWQAILNNFARHVEGRR